MKPLFLLLALLFASVTSANAALTLRPQISGYNPTAGTFKAPAGSFAMSAANDAYVAQAIVNVGGTATKFPASMRFAANAGQFALSAARLNPYVLAGTLMLSYLASQNMGIDPANPGVLSNVSPGTYWAKATNATAHYASIGDYCIADGLPPPDFTPVQTNDTTGQCRLNSTGNLYGAIYKYSTGTSSFSPVTDAQIAALPDPLPTIRAELPYAPYIPNGAPVTPPEFAPTDVPLGQPYTRPDGSTAQSRAKISPAGDGQVTVATYDQPLTDATGAPLSNAAPVATPDPQIDPCQANPDRAGCADLGPVPTAELMPHTQVNLSYSPISFGGDKTCPAPLAVNIPGLSTHIDFDSACQYANTLHPIVITIAFLSAALIIFGVGKKE